MSTYIPPKTSTTWRKDYADYINDPLFEETYQQLYDLKFKQLLKTAKPVKTPTLLLMLGVPGCGKSSIAKHIQKELNFIELSSLQILVFIEDKLKNLDEDHEKRLYPSGYVAWFYQERFVKEALEKGYNVISDTVASSNVKAYVDIASNAAAEFKLIKIDMEDYLLAEQRKISNQLKATKLSDFNGFEKHIKYRPDSDEAAFAKAYPNWKEKTYGDFTKGRWKRWHNSVNQFEIPQEIIHKLTLNGEEVLDGNLKLVNNFIAAA